MAQTPYSTDPQPTEVINATPARQGMRGVHVLWVLAISFILAAAALFGSWALRSHDLARVSPNNHATAADVRGIDSGPPAVKQNEP